jgi:amidase
MDRHDFLLSAAVAASTGSSVAASPAAPARRTRSAQGSVAVEELTLADISAAYADSRLTSRHLTQLYLERFQALYRRGPLHGVSILIKDNVETADRMMTTAGSLALEGWYAPENAPLVARLRAAGAVILGKTNLSEWANFRSTHPASGWSARGSDSQSLRAQPLAIGIELGVGGRGSGELVCACSRHETDGSIVSPASIIAIAGLKPTVGLVSRSGIIPISHSQDRLYPPFALAPPIPCLS